MGGNRRDRVNNVDVLGVEFAQNFKSVTDMWNRKTNSWLRYFVYMRLTPENGKASFFVTMLTYLTSAFWHVRTHSNTLLGPQRPHAVRSLRRFGGVGAP